MINETIVRKYLTAVDNSVKDDVIVEIFKNVSYYDYNNTRALHLLDMLSDSNLIIKKDDINMDYVNANINNIVYHGEDKDIINVTIDSIDNMECVVRIGYDYKDNDSVNENYLHSSVNVSFVDNPKILK